MNQRSEQQNVTWKMDLFGNFTNPGELVVNLFAGTCAFSKKLLFSGIAFILLGTISITHLLRVLRKLMLNCTLASYLTQNHI